MKNNKYKVSSNSVLTLIEKDEWYEYVYRVTKRSFRVGTDLTSQFVKAIIENLLN